MQKWVVLCYVLQQDDNGYSMYIAFSSQLSSS